VALTGEGRAAALRTIRAERIWQEALLTRARIDRDLIDLDAEEIGRALPPELVREIEASLRERGRLPAATAGGSASGPPTKGGA
jgi:Mn-dependent DtxR family transcriptional regulator